jgi:hypothetical protein
MGTLAGATTGVLTIGIFGDESEQSRLRYIVNSIQEQLNMVNRQDVDAFFCVDKTGSPDQEKKDFIKASCSGKYVVFVERNMQIIPVNFVRESLIDIESEAYTDIELFMKGIHKKPSLN